MSGAADLFGGDALDVAEAADNSDVLARLDDLEASLPRKVSEELQR